MGRIVMTDDDPVRQSAIEQPRFRGLLHIWCCVASIPVGLGLVLSAPDSRSAFAAAIFAFGISVMFGISALFHRSVFDDHSWYRFRRVDHMGIYLCIGGGFVPYGMLALDGWQANLLLIGGLSGVGAGILLRFLLFQPPFGMMNGLFIALGWITIATFPALWDSLGPGWFLLTLGGGAVYTVGALVVGIRWPDPWPQVFGYHEIWHAMVAIAATMHYVVVAFELVPKDS